MSILINIVEIYSAERGYWRKKAHRGSSIVKLVPIV